MTETTITYSHANFTIRQIMLAPKSLSAGTGAMVIYEMQAIRPMTVTFSFEPVMQRMWPADSPSAPSPEWVKNSDGSGFYILHLALPGHSAALTIPGSEPGILPPYQERAATWPLQFVVQLQSQRGWSEELSAADELCRYGGSGDSRSATSEAGRVPKPGKRDLRCEPCLLYECRAATDGA